ncbi:hypothetical protein BU26DRAFT_535575 [Trematosphaeria pertusa]|uniref:Uncharacterized protein n=1 Tax=Trematosphaeria pertusa TaxID=390896 RepID=A0A6A6HSA1_9PLEO|nr:uncharacterized protein BU26DRAFT_535575 [Trematosphaeria pertusa]KAF2241054.1 hypothetical protein BU26DRAFT_535575 [Trematosphaeria pertusa]
MSSHTLSKPQQMNYRIGRGEQGQIYAKFEDYDRDGDFVGMDMCRKFLQMGMTRAKRYANHKGGRKYDRDTGEELEKSAEHKDAKEKLEAALIFREVWERARAFEGYREKKEKFLAEQKEWVKQEKRKAKK